MSTENHYRWDFIGLSTDTKPTSETSEKVVNGSTYYCSDTSKLYVYCNGAWYERKPLGGGGGGGTSNFNDLSNRPKYNGSEMTGSTNIPEVKSYTAGTNVSISDQNVISATDTTYTAGTNVSISDQNVISATDTTYSAFTGTDGTAAGTAGLVPAPATTDAGKFLKADGTWDSAGGGGSGVIELTSADYNYHSSGSTDDGIALWLLPTGVYYAKSGVKIYYFNNTEVTLTNDVLYDVAVGANNVGVTTFTGGGVMSLLSINSTTGANEKQATVIDSAGLQQSTGTLTTSVMSQNAVTSMVFADPSTKYRVRIGYGSSAPGGGSVAIGYQSEATLGDSVAVGTVAYAGANGATAIGYGARATTQGQFDIGLSSLTSPVNYGYNNSAYRLLTGLYDPQSAHDAATKGYVDPTTDSSAPTTATVGRLGQIQIDTTNADAYMCVAVDTVTPSYTWKKINA